MRSSEPLEEQPHFFCVEVARNSDNGHPTGVLHIKDRSGKRGIMEGEVSERWTGLLEGPRVGNPPGCGTAVVAGELSPTCVAVTNASFIYWEVTTEETHQGRSFIDSTRLAMAKTSWKVVCPSWAIITCFHSYFFTSLIWWLSCLWPSFWACSLSLHSSGAFVWL